jgi:hypothetical protein
VKLARERINRAAPLGGDQDPTVAGRSATDELLDARDRGRPAGQFDGGGRRPGKADGRPGCCVRHIVLFLKELNA